MFMQKRKERFNTLNYTFYNNPSTCIQSDIDTEKHNIDVIKSNTKSIYSLSTSLKKEIDAIYNHHDNLNSCSNTIKDSIISTKDKINTLKRTSFYLSSSQKNLELDLNELNKSTNLLKDLLTELEDLSIMTTYLSQRTSLEKTYDPPSAEVIDIISEKFHNYSKEIRNAIYKMSFIFENFSNRYNSCKNEYKNSSKILDSYDTSLNDLTESLDEINAHLNKVVLTNTSLGNSATRSIINTRHLIANTSELRNNISHLGRFTYSISKLS